VNALSLLLQEGPNASLSWLLWVVLGFFLLMVVVGWLTSRNKGSRPVVQHEAHAQPEMPAVHEKPADDLTVLEGIGPKVARVLNEAGIMSFADLAQADAAVVQQALNAAGMRYMNPAGWIEQAKLAASGDMEGLKKLQAELTGGRKAG
jgi:predicted flap endonuclease-1-like 5' DNA nuclease